MDSNTLIYRKNERNYGIDLLKIVSMMMIVTMHVIGQGGIIRNTYVLSPVYNVAWLLETACYCCVNCYALCSGFVMYGRKFKYSNILNLYFEVVFYMGLSTIIFGIIDPDIITFKSIVDVFFPFVRSYYWYFTAYFGMFFFIPYLNIVIDKLSKKQGAKLFISMALIFSLLPTIFDFDIFRIKSGYSMFWLMAMYLVGAYFKKFDIVSLFEKRTGFLAYLISILSAYAIRTLFLLCKREARWIKLDGSYIVNYCSPFMIIGAAGLLVFFSQLKIKSHSKKFIKLFAPLTFGVYLIHVNPFIWEEVRDIFIEYTNMNPLLAALCILLSALVIYLLCTLIDKLRFELFKLIKVKAFSEKITDYISLKINKILKF